MKLSDFRQPATLEEATSLLKELKDKALPIAGGTSLHFLTTMKDRIAVDLTGLGLEGISDNGDSFEVGAATVVADLIGRRDDWVLCKAAQTLSTNQIRHMSTIGGNIVAVFPWADFPVALLALDGEATIKGDSERKIPFDEYFKGQPSRLFNDGDILTSIKVMKTREKEGFGYYKEVRTAAGFSMATGAAKVKVVDGNIETARVAVGACTGIPRRLTEVEDALKGVNAEWDEINKAVVKATESRKWRTTESQSAEYTAHLACVVLTDAIVQACEKAQKGA